jgi:hypothetical protein
LEPRLAPAWLVLAQIHGELGDYAKAVQCGRRAAELGERGGLDVAHKAEQLMGQGPGNAPLRPTVIDHGVKPRAFKQSGVGPATVMPERPAKTIVTRPREEERRTSMPARANSKVCKCGTENPATNAFCQNCGAMLSP